MLPVCYGLLDYPIYPPIVSCWVQPQDSPAGHPHLSMGSTGVSDLFGIACTAGILYFCLCISGSYELWSLRSRQRYHRAQRDLICLSVCLLSVIKLLPAYGTDHNQNVHTGSLGHCEGYSRFDIDRSPIARPPTPPQK